MRPHRSVTMVVGDAVADNNYGRRQRIERYQQIVKDIKYSKYTQIKI